jgi:Zn-finger nucleic acid-binding protein
MMKCPACETELQQMTQDDITLDVCENGCGGIWFDLFELQKVDESHESAGEAFLHIKRNKDISIDLSQRRQCPKCENMVMMQHFFSVKRDVSVDECPNCGGFWLDYGELGRIRNLFETEDERREAAKKYFDEVFGNDFTKMHSESLEKRNKAQKIAQMFRYICPSYYIPGSQEWGAF